MLEFGDFGEQPAIVFGERRGDPVLAGRQAFAQEDRARQHWLDRAEADAAARHQCQSVKGGALTRDHFAAHLVPVRFEVRTLDAVAGDALDPFRLDPRRAASVQAAGLGELAHHHPLRALLVDARTRMQVKADTARALVRLVFLGAAADVAQQSAQQCPMDAFEARVRGGLRRS